MEGVGKDRVGRLLAVPTPANAGSDPLGDNMNQWVLPTIAVLLLGYGAVSGRLQSTVVTQARPRRASATSNP